MKKVKLTLLAVLLTVFSLVSVSASNAEVGNNPLSKQIRQYVKYPEFGHDLQMEGKAIIVFSLTSDNQIKIENLICSNQELKNYIIASLEGKTVNINNDELKEKYAVSLEFRYSE